MKTFLVDCSIHWGQGYTVEAETYQEAEREAEKMFISDYELEYCPMTSVLGININSEEIEEGV